MRKADVSQRAMSSCQSLEDRIPATHPLRKLRILVDGILTVMNGSCRVTSSSKFK